MQDTVYIPKEDLLDVLSEFLFERVDSQGLPKASKTQTESSAPNSKLDDE